MKIKSDGLQVILGVIFGIIWVQPLGFNGWRWERNGTKQSGIHDRCLISRNATNETKRNEYLNTKVIINR